MKSTATRRFGEFVPSLAGRGAAGSGGWPTEEWSLSVAEAAALVRKATWPRLVFSLLAVLVAWPVASHAILAGWMALVVVWEFAARPALEDVLKARGAALPPAVAYRWLAALHFIGACGYAAYPVVAWSTGTAVGFVVATSWVCATANHAFVYFAHQRLLLIATLTPLVACALVAPFTTPFAAEPVSIVGMIVMVSAVLVGGLFGHDRTEMVRALSQARARRQAAGEASAAKSQFMALMSHELRTPLNAVIGYAELIEQDAPGPVAEDARRILKAAQRQLDLVNAVIDMARLEAGDVTLHATPVSGETLLDAIRRTAKPLAQARGNRLTISATHDLGELVVDVERLHATVMHLVSNAAKFTAGGDISVTAGRDGHVVRFRVADTGPGLSEAQCAVIFEPFAQADTSSTRVHEGAGLGLAVARQAARLMGGDITCESAPGAGAVFTLTVSTGR